jgi:hypothetical protein
MQGEDAEHEQGYGGHEGDGCVLHGTAHEMM